MNNLLDKYRSFLEGTSRALGVPQGEKLRTPRKVRNLTNSTKDGSEPSTFRNRKNLSKSSIKNYISDTRHFLTWLANSLNLSDQSPLNASHITPEAVMAYKQQLQGLSFARDLANGRVGTAKPEGLSLLENKVSPTTINKVRNLVYSSPATTNRRLSSLRRFGKFLATTGLLETDPTTNLTNPQTTQKSTTIGQVIDQYKTYLKSEALTESTIKNYASDLHSYLLWANKNNQNIDNQIINRQT